MSRFANEHERAFELACMAFAESIPDSGRQWLDMHLAACPECAARVSETAELVSDLKKVTLNAGVDLVQSTRRRVRALGVEREARRRRMRPIWISSAFASIWMACATPYLWQSFNLTGHWLHIPDLLWQMGFLVTWFTPALTGAAVALWLRPQLTHVRPSKAGSATA